MKPKDPVALTIIPADQQDLPSMVERDLFLEGMAKALNQWKREVLEDILEGRR